MYIIDQQLANQIAQTVQLQLLHTWFQAREEEIEEIEAALINQIAHDTGACIIGVAVTAVLPLLIEHESITKYIYQTNDYTLRLNIPDISTIKEARYFAEKEFTMTQKQADKVEEKLSQLWSQLLLSEVPKA